MDPAGVLSSCGHKANETSRKRPDGSSPTAGTKSGSPRRRHHSGLVIPAERVEVASEAAAVGEANFIELSRNGALSRMVVVGLAIVAGAAVVATKGLPGLQNTSTAVVDGKSVIGKPGN